MNVKHVVELTDDERQMLRDFVSSGTKLARKVKRAQVLLAAHQGYGDGDIADLVGLGTSTVYRVKRPFVERPFEVVLDDEPRPGGSRKLTCKEEALLVAKACSKPPEGRAAWTMKLLAEAVVAMTDHTSLSDETVRRRLAEKKIKPRHQSTLWVTASTRRAAFGHAIGWRYAPRIVTPGRSRSRCGRARRM